VAETMWSALFAIETRDPAIFALLCILLAVRPEGLLGRRET
jgi:branched-subunit amino acid ABC-type transport system permease component